MVMANETVFVGKLVGGMRKRGGQAGVRILNGPSPWVIKSPEGPGLK